MERKGKDQHNSIIISGYFMLVCNTNFMCACEMERGREYGYEDRDSVLYVLVQCVVKIHATYMHVERSQTMNAYTAPETEHRWCACHCSMFGAFFAFIKRHWKHSMYRLHVSHSVVASKQTI